MGTIFGRYPAAIVSVVMAVVAVLATYGLNVVPDPDKFQSALLAVLTLLASGAVIHTQVTPTASPVLPAGTPVTVPGGDTANPTATVQLQPTAGGPALAPKAQ